MVPLEAGTGRSVPAAGRMGGQVGLRALHIRVFGRKPGQPNPSVQWPHRGSHRGAPRSAQLRLGSLLPTGRLRTDLRRNGERAEELDFAPRSRAAGPARPLPVHASLTQPNQSSLVRENPMKFVLSCVWW